MNWSKLLIVACAACFVVQWAEAGVDIEVLKQGEGAYPTKGDRVSVHYTGKLTNGQVFDSSVERKRPFEFELGVGQVIRGWDEGIIKLNKGTKARLTITPDFAYGEAGAGGVIPPGSTLIFDVELLSINGQ